MSMPYIRRYMIDESSIRELCAGFSCQINSTFVYRVYERSSGKYTGSHRSPEKLMRNKISAND
jgi:hypothetical protein